MLDLLVIVWVPVTIAVMAVAWVVTLGAIGNVQPANEGAPGRSQQL